MKKGLELRTDLSFLKDTATGSPVIEIGYTYIAVPEKVVIAIYR